VSVDLLRLQNLPAELRELDHWIAWKYVERGDKLTKEPRRVDARHLRASTTDRATWTSFDQATAVDWADGVGYVFSVDDPFIGIDIDKCLTDGGEIHPAAVELVDTLASYTEISPSGRGLHVIVRAELPGGKGRRTKDTPWGGEIECYSQERFFCCTGDVL
jgi:primase-polymerase (primpol)-like protein